MRSVAAGLQSHLDTGVTTMSWCWKLTRTDGTILGFTDHDAPITVSGQVYEAQSGFSGTAVDSDLGLAVPTMDVQGVLTSDNLTEEDLQAGLWDFAAIELYRVNWADPTQFILARTGTVGEVTRNHYTFMAELRGLTHELNQPVGRTMKYTCDAELGDARCGLNLDGGLYTVTGEVTALLGHSRWFTCTDLAHLPSQWLTGGKLTWTSGDNDTLQAGIRLFTTVTGTPQLELWFPTPYVIQAGDTFSAKVGCDKQAATCRYRFNNLANFRGFHHMPDPSRIYAYPDPNAIHDGGSLFE